MPSRRRVRHSPGPTVGDRRRNALLKALADLLETRSFGEIGIGDIAAAAGVTRSAFYFYFPTKAAAVAALLADFEQEMQTAAAEWYEGRGGTPLERIENGFAATLALWRERAAVLVAMLDAVGTDPEVRDVWHTWLDGFIERVGARIDADRDEGLALDGPEARTLAATLMGSALFGMERELRSLVAGHPPNEELQAALVVLWHRTLYAA